MKNEVEISDTKKIEMHDELVRENNILKEQKSYYKQEYDLIAIKLGKKDKEIQALKKEVTILNRKFNER